MDSLLLNIKSNWKIIQLEELIKINDPSQDLSRTAVFEREVQAAQHVDWKEIQLSLLDLKKEDGTPLSTSFQAKVSPDTAKILEQVQSDMMHQLSLKRLKVNYMVLLLQRNYLDQLISRQKNLVRKKNVCKTDRMIEEKSYLENVAKSVVVDVIARTLMTSTDAEPMTQRSESALGYSVSGTYLVPGGGLFIKKSELARLGLKRQRIGVIDLYGDDKRDHSDTL